jgi:hypothetical protein
MSDETKLKVPNSGDGIFSLEYRLNRILGAGNFIVYIRRLGDRRTILTEHYASNIVFF